MSLAEVVFSDDRVETLGAVQVLVDFLLKGLDAFYELIFHLSFDLLITPKHSQQSNTGKRNLSIFMLRYHLATLLMLVSKAVDRVQGEGDLHAQEISCTIMLQLQEETTKQLFLLIFDRFLQSECQYHGRSMLQIAFPGKKIKDSCFHFNLVFLFHGLTNAKAHRTCPRWTQAQRTKW